MEWSEPETHESGTIVHRFRNRAADTPGAKDKLVLVDVDGSARVVADDLMGPNGLAISGDGVSLFVAEWRANRLTKFKIAPDGSLTERTLFAQVEGLADGICVDVEGAVWMASPTTGVCQRVLQGGRITDRVTPLGNRVTACVLGGADRKTLFLTTDENPRPATGRIEAVEVNVPGEGYP